MDLDARITKAPIHWHNNRLHFFKYMTASTAKVVLANRTLRWSTASLLNDPFDMQFDMSIDVDREKLKESALEKMWGLYSSDRPIPAKNLAGALMEMLRKIPKRFSRAEFDSEFGPVIVEGYDRMLAQLPKTHAQAEPYFSRIKILSLTATPNNNLMWTHYADGHSGVVMRFRSIPEIDSPFGMARPMNYVTEVPSLFSEDDLVNISAGISNIDASAIMDKVIYTKSADYEYEQEWRISSGSGRDVEAPFEDLRFGRDELDGIIFGLKTSDADKDEIRALAAEYPAASIMRAVRGRSSLELSIEAA